MCISNRVNYCNFWGLQCLLALLGTEFHFLPQCIFPASIQVFLLLQIWDICLVGTIAFNGQWWFMYPFREQICWCLDIRFLLDLWFASIAESLGGALNNKRVTCKIHATNLIWYLHILVWLWQAFTVVQVTYWILIANRSWHLYTFGSLWRALKIEQVMGFIQYIRVSTFKFSAVFWWCSILFLKEHCFYIAVVMWPGHVWSRIAAMSHSTAGRGCCKK